MAGVDDRDMGPRARPADLGGFSVLSRRGRSILRWIIQTLSIGVAAGAVGLVAQTFALMAGNLSAAVWLRGLLALLILVSMLAAYFRAWRVRSWSWQVSSVVAAYMLMPLSWVGQALFGRFLTGNPWVTMVLDLLVWVGSAALVLRLQMRRYDPATDPIDEGMEWVR